MVRITAVVTVMGLGGCAGILGIPSDVDRDDTTLQGAETGVADGPGANETSVAEAGPEADADAEAGPQGPCDLMKPFGGVVPVGGVNTSEDEGSPHLSDDETMIYLDAYRTDAGQYDIYFAKRAAIGGVFGPLQTFGSVDNSINMPNINNVGPTLTADGKTLFFERQSMVTNSDLWMATRQSLGDPFDPATKIASLDTVDFEAEPFVRSDGQEIWFTQNHTSTSVDIAVATSSGGSYVIDTSGILAAVNDPDYFDGYPVISRDKLTLFFGSDRPSGNPLLGALDIYVAKRPNVNVPFGAPSLVGGDINTTGREYPGFISLDGCRLYFSSVRTGGKGGQDIYVTTRPQ